MKNIKRWFFEKLIKIFPAKKSETMTLLRTNRGLVTLDFPKEGGILSHIPGMEKPFPGMPDERIVNAVANVKRLIPVFCKHYWVKLKDHIPQKENYDIPVREIYKILFNLRAREKDSEIEMKGKWTELRDLVCMIIQSEINPKALDEFCLKEIREIKDKFALMIVEYGWQIVRDYRFSSPKAYSYPVREIYKFVVNLVSGLKEGKEFLAKAGELFCMFMENDDEYRFRFMDVFIDIDLNKVIDGLDPVRFGPYVEALKKVDLKKFEFDENHRYWAEKKSVYNYQFKKIDGDSVNEKK